MGFGSSRPLAIVIPAPFPATSRQTQQANAPSVLFKIQNKSKPVNLPDAHRPQKDPIQLNLIPCGENPAKGNSPTPHRVNTAVPVKIIPVLYPAIFRGLLARPEFLSTCKFPVWHSTRNVYPRQASHPFSRPRKAEARASEYWDWRSLARPIHPKLHLFARGVVSSSLFLRITL